MLKVHGAEQDGDEFSGPPESSTSFSIFGDDSNFELSSQANSYLVIVIVTLVSDPNQFRDMKMKFCGMPKDPR